jgi:hypothetical protein
MPFEHKVELLADVFQKDFQMVFFHSNPPTITPYYSKQTVSVKGGRGEREG